MDLGRWQVDLISAGTLALDGGAMFGIVPKPLWEKKIPADEKNRIPLDTRCVVLRDGERLVLIDCGMGTQWNDKERDIYRIDAHLDASLAAVGVTPADVTDLVLTHLHFDHAGDTARLDAAGTPRLTFTNARVHVGRRAWELAHAPNERDRGSFRAQCWAPLDGAERPRVVLVDDRDGRASILPELDAMVCEGHTTGQLLPLIGAADQRALYGADMFPTRAHVPVPWHMGYDLRPLVVMEEKRRLVELCVAERITLIHEHDTRFPTSSLSRSATGELSAS
ncbi:MAG: MBL fold metallo-hydrolase [Deltaproteobacteria bacterium]|nr:MBL fold metallo-hydrolase [Deltaproteobacteria bacterium]